MYKKPIQIKWNFTVLPFIAALFLCSCASSLKRAENYRSKGWKVLSEYESGHLPEKELDNAINYFNKSLSLEAANYSAIEGLARAEYFKGNYLKSKEHYTKVIELSPEEPSYYNNRANCFKELKSTKEAMQDYLKAIELSPEVAIYYKNLGLLFYGESEYEEALRYFEKSLKYLPNQPVSYWNRAKAKAALGRNEEAYEDMKLALELDQNNYLTHYELGNLYLNDKRFLKGINAYDKAFSLNNKCTECLMMKAYARLDSGQYETSIREFNNYILKFGQSNSIYLYIGYLHSKLGNNDSAFFYYDRILKADGDNFEANYQKASLFANLGRLKEAEYYYDRSMRIDTGSRNACYDAARNFYRQERFQKAISLFEKGSKRWPKDIDFNYGLFDARRDSGLFSEAMATLMVIKGLKPKNAWVYNEMAKLYEDMKEIKLAGLYFDSTITLCDTNKYYFNRRGYFHLFQKNYPQSVSDFKKAISLDSTFSNGYNNLGMTYFFMKDYNNAATYFAESIRRDSMELYPHNNLANCYFYLGKQDKACFYWKKALAMGYKYQAKWKEEYGIDDPVELVKQHCK